MLEFCDRCNKITEFSETGDSVTNMRVEGKTVVFNVTLFQCSECGNVIEKLDKCEVEENE